MALCSRFATELRRIIRSEGDQNSGIEAFPHAEVEFGGVTCSVIDAESKVRDRVDIRVVELLDPMPEDPTILMTVINMHDATPFDLETHRPTDRIGVLRV